MAKAALEISKTKSSLPSLLLQGVIAIAKSQIKKRASFDLEAIDVMPKINTCSVPALFIASA
jgi:hypothetical protein